MYGLPPEETFGFFVGFVLSSFSVSRHQLNLSFANPAMAGDTATISVEGSLGVRLARQQERVFDNLPEAAQQLSTLLDLVVTDVVPHRPGTLALHFADGSGIRAYDSSAHYESYQVRHGEAVFVV